MFKKLFSPKSVFLAVLLVLLAFRLPAQELRCMVNIQTPGLSSDPQVYQQLQEAVTKYMNLRKWSEMKYEPNERIKCQMLITLNERPSVDQFRGTLQIQVVRPAYNSTYETVIANIQDRNISFKFVPFQPLEFSENSFIDNLTSILNFYAYIIIGMDMASFELNGGKPYFQKAQNIVNLAQSSGEPGWRNFDGPRNRFWLANNLLDNALRQVHNVYYVYHRQGIDQMEKDLNRARAAILGSLREMQKLNMRFPAKYITRIFLTVKRPEILEIYRNAIVTEKRQLISIMENLDPANLSEYQKLMQN